MTTRPHATLVSRLTAGCVTLVIALALAGAAVGWWWKWRAATRHHPQQQPAETASPAP